uniref:Uncharacterized protein n=1 Tax=Rhizophagus irregularis (strain DAOM 181602 / DAOM 197198 / MUCL 43194) TaxID=747089 RepID=U9UUQ5_RHIID
MANDGIDKTNRKIGESSVIQKMGFFGLCPECELRSVTLLPPFGLKSQQRLGRTLLLRKMYLISPVNVLLLNHALSTTLLIRSLFITINSLPRCIITKTTILNLFGDMRTLSKEI